MGTTLRYVHATGKLRQLIDDLSIAGARGVWITDSCDQSSTPTTQPPENSMGAEAPTTLGATTVPTFTARYSQPGHFGLLLVSQVCERVKTCCSTCSYTYFYTYT